MSTREETDYICVHCSATKPSADIGVAEITVWHKARKFRTIGYHKVIRRNGVVEQGRQTNEVGAHVKGYNKISVGICMVGGINDAGDPSNNFTPEQYQSLKTVLSEMKRDYPSAKIVGHRDLSKDQDGDGVISPWEWEKSCPCFDVADWLAKGGLF